MKERQVGASWEKKSGTNTSRGTFFFALYRKGPSSILREILVSASLAASSILDIDGHNHETGANMAVAVHNGNILFLNDNTLGA